MLERLLTILVTVINVFWTGLKGLVLRRPKDLAYKRYVTYAMFRTFLYYESSNTAKSTYDMSFQIYLFEQLKLNISLTLI